MSFGSSVGDVVLLVQLAWTTVQNSRKACGEHDELTREVLSLHAVLRRLELEMRKAESPINTPEESYGEELRVIVNGCKKVLGVLDKILERYMALGSEERHGRKLWQRIRFGNGEMTDLGDLRGKMIYYTSSLNLFMNIAMAGSMGRVEKQMDEAGGDIRDIKLAVNGITAHLVSKGNHEGSVFTAYGDDDRAVWREFRRELLKDGFSSSVLRTHKATIKAYVTELAGRGLLDEEEPRQLSEDWSSFDLINDTDKDTDIPKKTKNESTKKPKQTCEAEKSHPELAESGRDADPLTMETLQGEAAGLQRMDTEEANFIVDPRGYITRARPACIYTLRKYVDTEALDAYELPWEWDDETCLLITDRWQPERDLQVLFQHMQKRHRRLHEMNNSAQEPLILRSINEVLPHTTFVENFLSRKRQSRRKKRSMR